jgi:protein PhnA
MSLEKDLYARAESKCELCGSLESLGVYALPLGKGIKLDENILFCATCLQQIDHPEMVDVNHWRCLNESMWSTVPAVQVVAWRMLNRLKAEGWPQDLLDMLYLDEETLAWAKETGDGEEDEDAIKHMDSNGVELLQGDSVVLIKDLNVKGSSMVAKRGTAVRNISLVHDNPEHIEGKVNGQTIVILTKFVKK